MQRENKTLVVDALENDKGKKKKVMVQNETAKCDTVSSHTILCKHEA